MVLGAGSGVPLQSQTSPPGLTVATLGFAIAWLPPCSQAVDVVAEGFVDSIPVTQAEANFMTFLLHLGDPAVSLLPLSIGYMPVTQYRFKRRGQRPRFWVEVSRSN